ncbi:hypothetical protein DM860_015525 [Cuscuta australis]|uniref:Uncharacterized protein n=1 Tax=Cuscuta australis TaxID=267555 RepID=A0A328DLD9_9ASTE|nr:hypothetical protein DM860_015525 [Cuscuta australis]
MGGIQKPRKQHHIRERKSEREWRNWTRRGRNQSRGEGGGNGAGRGRNIPGLRSGWSRGVAARRDGVAARRGGVAARRGGAAAGRNRRAAQEESDKREAHNGEELDGEEGLGKGKRGMGMGNPHRERRIERGEKG